MKRVPGTQAIQLNIASPAVNELWLFQQEYPVVQLILQAGSRVLAQCKSPASLMEYLRMYDGLAEYALIEPSGGLGHLFQVSAMQSWLGRHGGRNWAYCRDCRRFVSILRAGVGVAAAS